MTVVVNEQAVVLVERDVRFDEVAPGQWRVLDARAAESDIEALLGFACTVAGLVEVTSMRHPLERVYCADLESARVEFLDR